MTDINHMCESSITYYHSFVTRFVKKQKKGRKAPYFLIFIGHPSHPSDLLMLVFVRHRASCGVRRAWTFYIFNFLKILLPFLVWSISLIREILIVMFMAPPSTRATCGEKYAKQVEFQKSSPLPHMWGKH